MLSTLYILCVTFTRLITFLVNLHYVYVMYVIEDSHPADKNFNFKFT